MTYQVGDWVIHDYEIKQIVKVLHDGTVREVSCGAFSTSGQDLLVRPLTLRNKRIAESIEYYDKSLREAEGSRALNWPDIHRYFCSLCAKAIDDTTDTKGKLNKYLQEAEDFVRKVKDKLDGVDSANGVKLFR